MKKIFAEHGETIGIEQPGLTKFAIEATAKTDCEFFVWASSWSEVGAMICFFPLKKFIGNGTLAPPLFAIATDTVLQIVAVDSVPITKLRVVAK